MCPESLEEQADVLGKHFEFVSSSENYTPTFLRHKEQAERKTVKTSGGVQDQYNTPFTPRELQMVLHCSKQSAPRGFLDRFHFCLKEEG